MIPSSSTHNTFSSATTLEIQSRNTAQSGEDRLNEHTVRTLHEIAIRKMEKVHVQKKAKPKPVKSFSLFVVVLIKTSFGFFAKQEPQQTNKQTQTFLKHKTVTMNTTSTSSSSTSCTLPRRIGGNNNLTDDDFFLSPLSIPSRNGGLNQTNSTTRRTLSPQERQHQFVISILDQALLVVFDEDL